MMAIESTYSTDDTVCMSVVPDLSSANLGKAGVRLAFYEEVETNSVRRLVMATRKPAQICHFPRLIYLLPKRCSCRMPRNGPVFDTRSGVPHTVALLIWL